MKKCQLFIVLIVFIFLSGCGNEVSTSTKDSSATITMAYLDGTWSEKCQYDSSDGSSYKTGAVFSDSADNVTISTSYYSGSICNNDFAIVRQKINTISIGSKVTLSSGHIVTKYTAVISDYTVEPTTSTYASALNNISHCGITSWTSGTETSIAGLTCGSITISSANDGFKDIVQMNSERTYIRTGSSEVDSDGYPTSLYANKYIKE